LREEKSNGEKERREERVEEGRAEDVEAEVLEEEVARTFPGGRVEKSRPPAGPAA